MSGGRGTLSSQSADGEEQRLKVRVRAGGRRGATGSISEVQKEGWCD